MSTPEAKYLIVYVNNSYLNNPMKNKEYYKIAINLIPQDILEKYELTNKQVSGSVYVIS